MTTVNIEIDGKKVQARGGAMVIEAADEVGIYIPRFCYHKKLSIAANCRMCLVDIEKAAKPLPACATPVTEGMKIQTRSPKALAAQKGVMEFLLINHPLDCPICDQGGECELQDIALGFGRDASRYAENKRVVRDKNIGPLIATEMTRCIHCTRCVRFGEEIAGIRELGATGRGEHMEIGTFVASTVSSELSGNVIDLCPVGALTSKPFRFSARAWEMTQFDSIAPHDCIGSNLHVHVRRNKIMRVVPRDNEEVNETWISDRDRFSYEALDSATRLTVPMIRKNGVWEETDWSHALEFAARGIRGVVERNGAHQLCALAAPSSTVEEMYLLQRLLRGLGSHNIDHRLRQLDFSDQDIAPLFPSLGQTLADLERVDAALLIGSNVRKDQPLAALRLRKAALNGAQLMFVNPVDYPFVFPVREKLTSAPQHMAEALAGICKGLLQLTGKSAPADVQALVANISVSPTQQAIAEQLHSGRRAVVLLGNYAHAHPRFATLRALAGLIAELSGASLGYLTEGANSAGAWLAGAVPHRLTGGQAAPAGLDAQAMWQEPRKAYVLLGVEPELDCANAPLALRALAGSEFTVAMTTFRNAMLDECAQVLLPVSPFTETSGTYVNAEGRWQSFRGVVNPLGETRPAWKVLRVLGNMLDVDGFEYVSSEEVREEVRGLCGDTSSSGSFQWRAPRVLNGVAPGVVRIAEVPIYGSDALVRRAPALQQTADAAPAALRLNSALAARHGLRDGAQVHVRQGDCEVTLPVVIDDRVADESVVVPAGLPEGGLLKTDFEALVLQAL